MSDGVPTVELIVHRMGMRHLLRAWVEEHVAAEQAVVALVMAHEAIAFAFYMANPKRAFPDVRAWYGLPGAHTVEYDSDYGFN